MSNQAMIQETIRRFESGMEFAQDIEGLSPHQAAAARRLFAALCVAEVAQH